MSQLKDVKKYHFLLVKGTRLYFDVNLTKLKSAGEESHYRFWIELLEDLYLHTCNNWQSEKSPALYGCHCKVDKEGSGNLDFFEPIYAKSVNEVISKTRQYYFPNQGTPSASVYVIVKRNHGETLEDLRRPLMPFFV